MTRYSKLLVLLAISSIFSVYGYGQTSNSIAVNLDPLDPSQSHAASNLLGAADESTLSANPYGDVKIIAPTGVEGAAVSGDYLYPTVLVLQNLGLPQLIDTNLLKTFSVTGATSTLGNSNWKTPEDVKDKKILSLGEGTSGLVPYFRSKGANAVGLDLWYDPATPIPEAAMQTDIMRAYRKKYQHCLIEGSASDLCGIESGAIDLITSHKVFNYLDPQTQSGMLSESVRVVKDGGTIHFNYANVDTNSLVKTLGSKGYKVEIEYFSPARTQVELIDENAADCDFIQSFSSAEIDQIQGLRDILSNAKAGLYPINQFDSLLVIKKISGPDSRIESRAEEERLIDFLSALHRAGPQSLKELNSYVNRPAAFGSEPPTLVTGILKYPQLLTQSEGTAPLTACYGFIPLWKSLGQGNTYREQIESGLRQWRQDLTDGKKVQWPDPSAPCSTQEYVVDLSTGVVTQR